MNLNKILKISGAIVFTIATIVFLFSAERTGSLWDCGEFILGAYKLQVVHPPGAPLFMLIGRLFTLVGDLISSNPSDIAFALNIMSSLCTAATATFVGWSTIRFSSLLFGSREEQSYDQGTSIVLIAAGIAAGLTTAFCTSIWFSAVEGEVYAMSTMFTAMTVWAVVKWYTLPEENDRWLIFAIYAAGLSIGVHLLSLLTFPALAILVYVRKAKKTSLFGILSATAIGAAIVPIVQKVIVSGIPSMWQSFDIFLVNSLGLPYHFGIIPTLLVIGAIIYFMLRYAKKKNSKTIEIVAIGTLMTIIGFSTFGTIPIRANADTPVNMNVPSDAARMLPYLNREQYGERPLLYGPHYEAAAIKYDRVERKGRVSFPPYLDEAPDSEYVPVDEKITPVYKASDKMLFPRIAHAEQGRPGLYKQWYQHMFNGDPKPSFGFNIAFFLRYQIGWVYSRYFMWNFVGRQNGEQGFNNWDKSSGHWASGVGFVDEARLYSMDKLPETKKRHKGTNSYYFLPLIFGLIGLFYQAFKSKNEFYTLIILFLITGVGIILYVNSPPNEPRERDYVFVGSFFTFCIWIGMAVPALYKMSIEKLNIGSIPSAALASVLVLTAPFIMAFQNFDDSGRAEHYASSDYAKNFLNSLEENAIIFTYGDNDTYPLWYVQEVENVRTDVRIVNLSLIAVDWYINKLRRKVNDSEALKLTVPAEAYRGNQRNQLPFFNGGKEEKALPLADVLKFVGEDHPVGGSSMQFKSYVPTHQLYIPTNYEAARRLNMYNPADSLAIESEIRLTFGESKGWLTKDDLAIMDVIASNIWERPIYFATTCKNEKLLGLNDYMQYEGLALRIVPIKTPSDRSLSIYGSGRVDTEEAYDNIVNKFVWGNFDKKELFVDNSYGAAVQAHRMVMMRTAEALLKEGQKQKSIDVLDKYFEGFPHMNFPYDASTSTFIQLYIQAGDVEKAKFHARILATETADFLEFYNDIDPDVVQTSFASDMAYRQRSVNTLLSFLPALKDEAFKKEMEEILNPYRATQVPN